VEGRRGLSTIVSFAGSKKVRCLVYARAHAGTRKPISAVLGLSCDVRDHNRDASEAAMSDLITLTQANFEAEVGSS
jgi:hypothetical protein